MEQNSNLCREFSPNLFARQTVRKGAIFSELIFDPMIIAFPLLTFAELPTWFASGGEMKEALQYFLSILTWANALVLMDRGRPRPHRETFTAHAGEDARGPISMPGLIVLLKWAMEQAAFGARPILRLGYRARVDLAVRGPGKSL